MKKVMGLALIGLLSLYLFQPFATQAAIPVIDTENILQQYKTYIQEAQTVINTAQQIQLQIKELTSLPASTISSFQSILNSEMNKMKNLLTSTTGALNPQKTLDSVWDSIFRPKGDLVSSTNITSSTVSAVNATTISGLDTVNYEAMKIVKVAVADLEQTQKNIDNLVSLAGSAEGAKQTGQVQNMILAEQTKLMQKQNVIRAAEANARISYFQRQNQLDAIAQAIGNKAAEETRNMDLKVTSK
ncbi:MAG: type secretion system family protein [Firmicutes bacterium]|nr:type secretion system family protein [Bacillota bacterium]